ncbi:MAG: hypothetical protein PHF86_06280 [Candidatus Nanoarchaeia archaeon]|nr:hypothetical protein [Candidatus Nanoarchaeia archaeon]
MNSVKTKLEQIEQRFLEVSGLKLDLSQYPLSKSNEQQVITNKEKSDKHGEVFTPLWLVDEMLERYDEWENQDKTTEDLCAGYGQFSVRMLRKKYSVLGERFEIDRFLSETHLFSEIQPGSCFRLLYIFGTGIRLLMGDVMQRGCLPDEAEIGIWVFVEDDWKEKDKILVPGAWQDKTNKIKQLFKQNNKNKNISENADNFERYTSRFYYGFMRKEDKEKKAKEAHANAEYILDLFRKQGLKQ